jgi:mRNA interferase RelE/StbE
MYEVIWKPKARKQLNKIGTQQDRESVYFLAGELKNWPQCSNVKPLTNHQYKYRLRIGRYRVFFDVHDVVRIIDIQEVKKRDNRTY